jgi:hypothetical protein
MNRCDPSYSALHLFPPYVFLHIAYIIISNGENYLYQMVCTCTGDFALDVPEASGARGGAAPTGPRGIAPTSPLLPPPPVSIKQLLAS